MSLTAAWFWPSVNSCKDALFAIEEAFRISVGASIFTLIFVLIEFLHGQESDFDILGLFTSVFFAGVAFGIRRKSRIAATAGLLMYFLLRMFLLPPTGLGSFTIGALIALAFLHGVRGTCAYHNLPPWPPGMPSVEQSFRAVAVDSHVSDERTSKE